jgi:hypothetical protein
MFSFSDALFTFSFLVTIVKSAPRPAPQSFEHDASWLSMPLDNLPYEDEWVNYALPADLFDWNPTPDPNLSWNEGDLFATDVGSGEFCSAEDLELSPLIGRLRAREGSEYGSGAGKTCAAPTEGDNDEELTPFLLQLPELEEVIFPPVKSEREICPISKYGKRDIPLCSSGDPNDVIFDRETISIILVNAKLCKSMLSPIDFL